MRFPLSFNRHSHRHPVSYLSCCFCFHAAQIEEKKLMCNKMYHYGFRTHRNFFFFILLLFPPFSLFVAGFYWLIECTYAKKKVHVHVCTKHLPDSKGRVVAVVKYLHQMNVKSHTSQYTASSGLSNVQAGHAFCRLDESLLASSFARSSAGGGLDPPLSSVPLKASPSTRLFRFFPASSSVSESRTIVSSSISLRYRTSLLRILSSAMVLELSSSSTPL